ncbi:MAG: dihydrofolate reductase family protein [Promethearchaeota archaeon]|jgi:riboflavin biosynthesis pyrimidine reductase
MEKPFVVVGVTTSLDGRLSLVPKETLETGYKINLENYPKFKNLFGVWQPIETKIKDLHKPDTFMEGSNMVMYEGQVIKPLPKLTGEPDNLYKDFLPEEIVDHPKRKYWLAIVDGKGRLRSGYKGNENPENHIIHLTSYSVPPEYLVFLQNQKIPYLITGQNRVNLRKMLQKMYLKLGIKSILTSSAGKLSGALIREDLIDEINILLNPVVIGGFNTPILFASPEVTPPEILPTKLELISLNRNKDGSVWLRYKVIHN